MGRGGARGWGGVEPGGGEGRSQGTGRGGAKGQGRSGPKGWVRGGPKGWGRGRARGGVGRPGIHERGWSCIVTVDSRVKEPSGLSVVGRCGTRGTGSGLGLGRGGPRELGTAIRSIQTELASARATTMDPAQSAIVSYRARRSLLPRGGWGGGRAVQNTNVKYWWFPQDCGAVLIK